MVGIVFFFEDNDIDVWSGRRIDFDVWNNAVKTTADVRQAIIINKTSADLQSWDADMEIIITTDFPTLSGRVAHLICPWNNADTKISLWDFDHQVDWYVFGPAAGWHEQIQLGITIPQYGTCALHSLHVASIVMMHRFHTLQVPS